MPAEVQLLPDEGERPKDNHLVLMTGDGTGIAIPPGATLVFVTGDKAEDIYPTILAKVTRGKMVFACGCGKPACTRRFVWKITGASGSHPQRG